ncbi:6-phosphofructokinase [uncultured Microscilla sp.]|uniref:6-phosphofructokinase n=1 Tax=uncultured Microscilla sp. TaxID=432653 RepID=UPI00260FA309|nr:6-phosphofructokinase [uncultured Microscilla sp.]
MKRIAVFTSGGDAPGMNACIRAVVRTAIYNNIEVYGIMRGYEGMIKGRIHRMESKSVSNIIQQGGTILKSARSAEFRTYEGRKQAYQQLKHFDIDGLVAVGGDGTFTGAKVFHEEFGMPTVGCPGTIDNDIYGTDYTIGYDTAVNTALEAIDKIRDTADSHNRVFFVEVMGRDSGYIAIQSGIGGGAEIVMVPETETTIAQVIETLQKGRLNHKSSSIVIVAEGDEEGNAADIAAKVMDATEGLDIKVTTLGHIQRGGSPTAQDRILASRTGIGAVEGLLAGKSSVMAGVKNNKLVYTPFEDAIDKNKPIEDELIKLVDVLSI